MTPGVHTSTKNDKAPTFLNMGGAYPNNTFTVVIFKDDAGKFSYQLSTLDGKNICVTGTVKEYNGKPEIIVNKESQIKTE